MNLEEIIRYICKRYPYPEELSKARLTKLVYLADWESCKKFGRQLSNIKWFFHNFGPYVDDVVNCAKSSPYIDVIETENFYGERKELVKVALGAPFPNIDKFAIDIIHKIIDETKDLYWNDFIEYVYNTPPVAFSERYSTLNLNNFAKQRY